MGVGGGGGERRGGGGGGGGGGVGGRVSEGPVATYQLTEKDFILSTTGTAVPVNTG